HHPAHGRRPELGVVAGRAVVTDLLAPSEPAELVDGDPRAQEGDEQRYRAAQQDGSHRLPLCVDPDRSPMIPYAAPESDAARRRAVARCSRYPRGWAASSARTTSRSSNGWTTPSISCQVSWP